jgi:glycerophosphoryl diester phosphodiesterase
MTQKQTLLGDPPILVAHRGYSGRYPENTLLAYQAAYQHGARHMELDLQLTVDRVPVLHHDASMLRMAGVANDVRDLKCKEFKAMRATYAERFNSEFEDNEFTTFRKYCKWLKAHPDVTTFVEIKQESIDRFGIPVFIDEVLKRIHKSDVESQCVAISFNHESLNYARKVSPIRTGWVLPKWNSECESIAFEERYDYLFADAEQLPAHDEDIWQGSWQWAIYNLDDVASAVAMANRGIAILETNQIGTLMGSTELRS